MTSAGPAFTTADQDCGLFAEVTRVLAEHGIDDTVIGEDDTTKRKSHEGKAGRR
jgi:hypothetical protein